MLLIKSKCQIPFGDKWHGRLRICFLRKIKQQFLTISSVQSETEETDGGVATVTQKKIKTKKPKQYKVFLLNDDYTSMDFVVAVLEQIFSKSPAEAIDIMLRVHKLGKGLAGIYSKEIAEAKIAQVHGRAKDSGYPLRCSLEDS